MENNPPLEPGLTEDELTECRLLACGEDRSGHQQEDLPVDTREIILVKSHCFITSNYIESAANPQVGAAAVILLRGVTSASTNGKPAMAYITFVKDEAKVPRPRYSRSKNTIWLWMPFRQLPVVMAQMHEPAVYCWIGHFAGGHIYADIHTSH